MTKLKRIATKVLVVENDPDFLNALNIGLAAAGFDVDVLLRGKPILNNQFALPDLFIIDKQLPDIDGLEICRFLHSKPNYKNVPVIMISGVRGTKKKAFEAGAARFIEKPFTVQDLVDAINQTLSPQTKS